MLKIDFTEKAIDEVYQQFMEIPSGLIKKKLHVVYLKALGLAHNEIERIARTSAGQRDALPKRLCRGQLGFNLVYRAPIVRSVHCSLIEY
ncbi:MAG: hypothetical protein QX198_02595 [Methylococcaceae bacterium]